MALFKISKGKSTNLPTNKVDGYCYVTTNDHKFYVDYTKDDGTLDRFALNAVYADSAGTATKLATARTIGLDRGVTSTAKSFDGSGNITIPVTSIKEAYLSWGGKNFNGTYGCIDAAMVSDLGANRLMFGKAAGIIIQYSRDGGNTWTDYGASDSAKVRLFSSGYDFNIGKATKDTLTTDCMLRVIIDTDAFLVYTTLNKFVIYLSTNGCNGCYCTIDASLQSSPTTFTTFADNIPVSGWSGYNVINTSNIITYGNSPSSQYGLIRFTFGCTSVNTNYSGLSVIQIMGFGGVGWVTPSTMAKTGHLYSYDSSQNATFPAEVTATTFNGSLKGNADTATKATKDGNGNIISSTYLPLSAGENNKLTGPLGLTENINYGASLPDDGFVGQVFLVEDEYDDNYLPLSAGENKKLTGPLGLTKNVNYGTSLPSTGFTGQLFFLESESDGSDGPSLPTGGTAGQVLIKNSSTDGDAKWSNLPVASISASGIVTTGEQIFAGDKTFNNNVYFGADGSYGYVDSNGVHGAMWNDYAEFRNQFEQIEPGYCVASTDDGKVYKTTEKFQACDGIVSDTFGFSIGKTDECKTPLAVAGRVLAYFYGNREDYHAGDTVCAGPEGKVMKMTREEIREWPDRIVGIVSEIPEYERWGSGKVEVNNRIWIKVK